MYSVKPVMLCVVAFFNFNKGVLLMTMGNWYLMHLRENSCLTMEFRKLVHVNFETSLESKILKIHRKTIICIFKIKF